MTIKEIERQIKKLLPHGRINKSYSPFTTAAYFYIRKHRREKEKNKICVDFYENNLESLEKCNPRVFVDFSKAFDSLDQNFMLDAL